MSILFRVDVDKPLGHHNLLAKIGSKLSEDLHISVRKHPQYLFHLKEMLRFLNERNVQAFFYFRLMTLPDSETMALLKSGNHSYGYHIENTRSFETFKNEIEKFNQAGFHSNHFTKHGSGSYKLGRFHYAPYEPLKYLEWADKLNLTFYSGNDIPKCQEDLYDKRNHFYTNVFWGESNYRDKNFNNVEDFVDAALYKDVIFLTHPENFYTHKNVKNDVENMISRAKSKNTNWIQEIKHLF